MFLQRLSMCCKKFPEGELVSLHMKNIFVPPWMVCLFHQMLAGRGPLNWEQSFIRAATMTKAKAARKFAANQQTDGWMRSA